MFISVYILCSSIFSKPQMSLSHILSGKVQANTDKQFNAIRDKDLGRA